LIIGSKVEVPDVVFVKRISGSEVGAVRGVSRGVLHSVESRHFCKCGSTLNRLLGVH